MNRPNRKEKQLLMQAVQVNLFLIITLIMNGRGFLGPLIHPTITLWTLTTPTVRGSLWTLTTPTVRGYLWTFTSPTVVRLFQVRKLSGFNVYIVSLSCMKVAIWPELLVPLNPTTNTFISSYGSVTNINLVKLKSCMQQHICHCTLVVQRMLVICISTRTPLSWRSNVNIVYTDSSFTCC